MQIRAAPRLRFVTIVATAATAVACSTSAAAEHAVFLNAPAEARSPISKFAGQFQLKLQLPEGKGLARMLLDAGVSQEDAGSVARLAAGHLGAGEGGCYATVSIERSADGSFSLMRVQLTTAARQTIIERRGSDLAIASDTATSAAPPLV